MKKYIILIAGLIPLSSVIFYKLIGNIAEEKVYSKVELSEMSTRGEYPKINQSKIEERIELSMVDCKKVANESALKIRSGYPKSTFVDTDNAYETRTWMEEGALTYKCANSELIMTSHTYQ